MTAQHQAGWHWGTSRRLLAGRYLTGNVVGERDLRRQELCDDASGGPQEFTRQPAVGDSVTAPGKFLEAYHCSEAGTVQIGVGERTSPDDSDHGMPRPAARRASPTHGLVSDRQVFGDRPVRRGRHVRPLEHVLGRDRMAGFWSPFGHCCFPPANTDDCDRVRRRGSPCLGHHLDGIGCGPDIDSRAVCAAGSYGDAVRGPPSAGSLGVDPVLEGFWFQQLVNLSAVRNLHGY
jgi:hypothetical protein